MISLSSDELGVLVAPSLGGRIVEVTDLGRARQWLWRNHHQAVSAPDGSAGYDDVWQGGFEELFPNDAPESLHGVELPDHGDLWSVPWRIEDLTSETLSLAAMSVSGQTLVRKSMSVEGPNLAISYRMERLRDNPLRYLFKLHAAIAVDEHCRIDLPGGFVEKVDPGVGNLLGPDQTARRQSWPTPVDLGQCRPASSGTNEFVYVHDLPQGWCAVADRRLGCRMTISYPTEYFPYCWIFMTYGGWRGHNVVVLEPCTNYPKVLGEAIEEGRAASLMPRAIEEFTVTVTVSPDEQAA
ncbi:MAG: hypothetical protein L0Z63_11305 [Actinobacteria bacterium]|nr:hypothetical protein [Actinomycetota bacterium]